MQLVKAITCESCAGSLSESTNSIRKCLYCGNYNIVLKNGATKVTANTIVNSKPKDAQNKIQSQPVLSWWVWIILIVGAVGVSYWVYMKFKKRNG